MALAALGLVVDSSVLVAAERGKLKAIQLVQEIFAAYGSINLALSPVAVAEMVHGSYRARSADAAAKRKAFVDDLLTTIPVHPLTSETAWVAGEIHGREAAKGNVLPMVDLMIAACAIEQRYAVLTYNQRHFEKVPGLEVVSL